MMAFLMYLQIDHYAVSTLHNLSDTGFWVVFGAICMFTFIMPILSLNMMKNSYIVSDWEVSDHKERVPLLISTSVFLTCLYYMFNYLESNSGSIFENFFSVILGGIVLMVLSAIISRFWKISLHAMMIAALAGAMIGMTATLSPIINREEMVMYNSILLLIVGIVGFARLHQKAHNILQVLAGMALGFTVEFVFVNQEWYI